MLQNPVQVCNFLCIPKINMAFALICEKFGYRQVWGCRKRVTAHREIVVKGWHIERLHVTVSMDALLGGWEANLAWSS